MSQDPLPKLNPTASVEMVVAVLFSFTSALLLPHAPPPASQARTRPVCASVVDDKAEVKEYFNNEGFNRWRAAPLPCLL